MYFESHARLGFDPFAIDVRDISFEERRIFELCMRLADDP